MKCDCCGAENARFEYDCIVVSNNYDSQSSTILPTEKHAVCSKCMLKITREKSLNFSDMGDEIGQLIFFIILIIAAGSFGLSKLLPSVFLSIVLATLIVGIALVLLSIVPSFTESSQMSQFFVGKTMKKSPKDEKPVTELIYLPISEKLAKVYKNKLAMNCYLNYAVCSRINDELIQNGAWKEYLKIKEMPKDTIDVQVPESEHSEILKSCVEELLRLYRRKPEGFIASSSDAEKVREVGEKLNEVGGMDLMLQAHSLFSRYNSMPGMARNLEMVWDRIGSWAG